MSEVVENKLENKPINNEIRVGNRTKPKDLIAQCEKLLKEDKLKEIHLSAVGNSIGDLIIAVEILKSSNQGLFQKNILSTIGPRAPKNSPKEKENEKPQKLYPHLEVVLSCEKIESNETVKISEEERKILIETLDKQKIAFKNQRKFRFRRNYGFRNRRQRFANRRNVNRFNRNVRNNVRNRSYNNMTINRRPRPVYTKRNNRRMFVKSPTGRRFNNPAIALNPASRGQSVNKEQGNN
jgi:hypothetical protein